MSVEFYRGSPGKFDSRTLSRKTLSSGPGVLILFEYNISFRAGVRTLLSFQPYYHYYYYYYF